MEFIIDISEEEKFYLELVLEDQTSRLAQIEINLINEDFTHSQKILLAYFGKKWGTFGGWHNTKPFHLDSKHIELSRELFKNFSYTNRVRNQKDVAYKIYLSFCKQIGQIKHIELPNTEKIKEEKWMELTKILNNLGIHKETSEFKRLIHKLACDQW